MDVRSGLFEGVSAETRSRLQSAKRIRRFEAGQDLFQIGAVEPPIFRIVAGRAKAWRPGIEGSGLLICYFNVDDVPGLITAAQAKPAIVTVTALTDLIADMWEPAVFNDVLVADGRMARNGMAIVARTLAVLADRLDDLKSATAGQQLARAILRLASEMAEWQENARATLKITRQDLADMTRVTLHTASRTLSDWARQGIVESTRGRITVLDPQALAEIAGVERGG